MGQIYARIFVEILQSSIAEDFTVRHVFEDFLKLCDGGIVDMTRQSISRQLNIPLDTLNRCITVLESPDLSSRDPECEGRRLVRIDDHRDWGWRIVNYEKYAAMKNRADTSARVARHRAQASGFDANAAIRDATSDPNVLAAWDAWVAYRREKRQMLTPTSAKHQIAKLSEWGPEQFVDSLNRSIMNSWTGIFPPDPVRGHAASPPKRHPVSGRIIKP